MAPMNTLADEIVAIKPRIDSLKANRNFFTLMFTLKSAVLAFIIKYLLPNYSWLSLTTVFLALTLICMLLGLPQLSD